jgi:phosphohistidine swiveling domain-containing protein
MSGTHWMVEGQVDPRWPINTRGNVGEVFPEVLTPLSYELGVLPAERAWRASYADLGVLRPGDFGSDDPVILGLYGGYCYLNMSFLRVMGVRAPGSSPEAIDHSLFGESDAPPYVARSGDRSLRASLKILTSVLGALGQQELPAIVDESFRVADEYASRRPALDAPDDELLAYLHSMPEPFEVVFKNHMTSTALASIVSGVLADACAAAGSPGLVTHLLGTAGDVRSARYSRELYGLSRLVRDQPTLTAAFDEGIDGLLDRIADDPAAAPFRERFDAFVAEHGHRGPNDWELSGRTWDNTPNLAVLAIDRMRRSDGELVVAHDAVAEQQRRAEAIAAVRPSLKLLDRLNFDKAIKAAPWWAQAREATRDRAVRCTMPAKQVFRELVRRGAERGGTPDPVAVALLSPITELPGYLADPASSSEVIAERKALFDRFSAVTPRFYITSQDEVPSIEELEAEEAARATATAAAVGDVLAGKAGCAGVARGRVRIVLDPGEADELEPGEVLVAPITDPAWTPLFLPAAAVVVNVGALMSHAVIVSRELEIPCVVSVEGATERLTDGMLVEVDGAAGTVTVVEA